MGSPAFRGIARMLMTHAAYLSEAHDHGDHWLVYAWKTETDLKLGCRLHKSAIPSDPPNPHVDALPQ